MADLRNYTVVMEEGFKTDVLEQELMTTGGGETVPDRAVESKELYPIFDRIATFSLTAEEADNLRQDPRVSAVKLPAPEFTPEEVEDAIRPTEEFKAQGYGKGSVLNPTVEGVTASASASPPRALL